MKIGNFPENGARPVIGKRYWKLTIGKYAVDTRWFSDGWRAFDFVVMEPYFESEDQGAAHPYTFRFAFAFWLPFYSL